MPRLSNRLPSYRLHKATGRAVVTLGGRDVYLGRYSSPESRAEYERVVAEWLTGGRTGPKVARTEPEADQTVNEVILAFFRHAATHYRDPDGVVTKEVQNFKDSLRPVRRLYGATSARSFGPLALRASRDAMVKAGIARTTINNRINRIRRVFKWAASMELIPASVAESLRTVDGLRAGRSDARESDPVGPVPIEIVEATLPHLPSPVAAMVRLQLLTGMRPGEVQIMRGADLTTEGATWEYRPRRHKNRWRGKARVVPIGPRGQEVIRPFLGSDPVTYLFEATGHGLRPRRYARGSYRQAIARACDAAFTHPTLSSIPAGRLTPEQRSELDTWVKSHRWSPLQLRHTAATTIRARYGLETAQTVLGHAKADVTQIYAERDLEKARAAMAEAG